MNEVASSYLLGAVPTARYDLGQEELAVGDVLFLYTDGLIERRDRDIDVGLMALLAAAGGGKQGQTADEAIAARSTASTRRSPKTTCACSPSASDDRRMPVTRPSV